MFTILFRKMRNTKWMVLCLFIGFLMAAGMMSTVPIYMDASLQRLLVKDMESYQTESGNYPGSYVVGKSIAANVKTQSQLDLIDTLAPSVAKRVANVSIPVDTGKTILRDNMLYLMNGSSVSTVSATRVKLVAMSDLEEHTTLLKGRMYVDGGIAEDGTVEVIISEEAIRTLNVTYDGVYVVKSIDTSKEPINVHIVGVYEQKEENDTYWSETMDPYINAVMTDTAAFPTLLPAGTVALTEIYVRYCLSYQSMDMNDLGAITAAINSDFEYYAAANVDFEMPIIDKLEEYETRAGSLTRILWILQIPTMVMLAFYLFMVSQLNVEQEKNEIAVFKSRGASSKQIFALYAMEAGVLGLVTLVIAPFIGLLLCQFLGVSNGFLEFVNRAGIAAKVTGTAVLYALLAVVMFFITTMIPIIPASKLTIVQYKQNKAKIVKMRLWEKCFIDVILIAAAIGFYMLYTSSLNAAITEGTFVATGEFDPMIFIAAVCLVMGLGLLFIRLYPYLVKLIYLVGKPFWSPSQYMALTTVSRSQNGKERFLMLFLVITFSFGLFSANTARAINNNKSDMIYYNNGADITLEEYWLENTSADSGDTNISYNETEFSLYENLEGVETATKVLEVDNVKLGEGGRNAPSFYMMAVEPSKFATVAWFRNDLLPVHWWNYCNALVDCKSGVLVSKSFMEKNNLALGDEISVKWSGNDSVSLVVLASIDYWPGINPNKTNDKGEVCDFIITNYNYIRSQTDLEPYAVWLKMKDGATSEALYADISAKKLPVMTLNDASQKLVSEKTEPTLQGMNGALTLGFIIIMIMTLIGFLIYWILSIKSRTLQFGILRAMGVSFREIIGILGYEQILVSGVSIAMSFIIGGVASDVFVPLFQSMYDIVDQIPPFRVAAMQSDYVKIYALIVIMLGGGFAILGSIIRKININKALKLGED